MRRVGVEVVARAARSCGRARLVSSSLLAFEEAGGQVEWRELLLLFSMMRPRRLLFCFSLAFILEKKIYTHIYDLLSSAL